MHQSVEHIVGGLIHALFFGVHDLMRDQETYGVGTLSVDLFLWVDAPVDEALHYTVDVVYEVLMI
jgi:hypothetical protein